MIHPADQLRLRAPLHRRAARPADAPTARVIAAPERLPLLPRRPALDGAADRRPAPRRFDSIFGRLREAGIRRSNLYLAWDFTVASDENIAAPAAAHARRRLRQARRHRRWPTSRSQGSAPPFSVTEVTELHRRPRTRRSRAEITGTFDVPCYLAPNCAPGGRFALDAGRPADAATATRRPTSTASSRGSRSTATRARPAPVALRARPVRQRGRGRVGHTSRSSRTITASSSAPPTRSGCPAEDLPNTAGILADLSDFPELADRLQQGLLNELFLGRLMIHPAGLRLGTRRSTPTAPSSRRR